MKRTQIALIGRPNVGKSTLVNRLANKRVCIVGAEAGVTRDRHEVDFEWESYPFTIYDTGGITFDNEDYFKDEIFKQATHGLNQADVILFMVDVTMGVTKEDERICQLLRKEYADRVFVAVNKCDSHEREQMHYEYYSLGFEHVYPVSAMHGSHGLSEMLDKIIEKQALKPKAVEEVDEDIIKISFVGKPNVGKSSLFNKVCNQERSIVSDLSGTTRDAIDIKLKRHGHTFELIDTAGLRRKAKINDEIERYSTMRTTHAIAKADVVILLINAADEDEVVSDQDQKIGSLIETKGKACVIAINKWDIFDPEIKNEPHKLEQYRKEMDYKLRFIRYAPVEYISAKEGTRTDKIWQLAIDAAEQHSRRIETSLLNKMLSDILLLHPPPIVKQKSIRIKYVTQIDIKPPTFLFFANHPELIPETYIRFMEKQFRLYFGFEGTPIRIRFKLKED
jgi:GTP-binding protein